MKQHILKTCLLVLLFFTITEQKLYCQNSEYAVKASYIEKFANFTQWPSDIVADTFYITVIGENPFEGMLEKMASKRKIKDLPVKINYITDIKKIGKCHILFISNSEEYKLNKILSALQTFPVLTIGDTEGFSEKGVHFNFYFTKKETIHFEVNPNSITKSKLKVDSMLLDYGKKLSEN